MQLKAQPLYVTWSDLSSQLSGQALVSFSAGSYSTGGSCTSSREAAAGRGAIAIERWRASGTTL